MPYQNTKNKIYALFSRTLCPLTAILLLAAMASSCTEMNDAQKVGLMFIPGASIGAAIAKEREKDDDDDDDAEKAAYWTTALLGGAAVTKAVIIARRKATAQQTRVAEANARRAYAGMSAKRKAALSKDGVRYLAVDTVRSSESTGRKDIMIYDTKQQKVSRSTAFDVKAAPGVGERVKFDTVITEYVGGR